MPPKYMSVVVTIGLGFCALASAATPQPAGQSSRPAFWVAVAEQSVQKIDDAHDPDYGLVTRAEALSLLAQSVHDPGEGQCYDLAIQATRDCILKIIDEDLRNQARRSLAEALAGGPGGGRFDEARQAVDAITDPTTGALALMSTAVAHARLGHQADYRQISAAAEKTLADALAQIDPDDPLGDPGWAWLALIAARLQADDVQGAQALTDQHLQHPADRTAALASISEKQTELGDTQAATATLDRALKALQQLQALLKETPDSLADTDLAYAALARAHTALGQQEQAKKRLARIDMTDFRAETLSACAVHLARLGQRSQARDALDQARALLDHPAQPLWINHWSWFEVSKNSALAGDMQATAQWIESLKDPTARALAELGVLRGLIQREEHSPQD